MEKESTRDGVKETIARNLAELRRGSKMTQQALAEKLNYSDKAISRWERGETLPDIETLCRICDIFGVSFEYLLQAEQPNPKYNPYIKRTGGINRLIITLIAICTVWTIATVAYSCGRMMDVGREWMLFIWAIPATGVVAGVCNRLWGRRIFHYIITSFTVWGLILSFYLQLLVYDNLWPLFLIGAPIQVILILLATARRI